MAQPGRISDLHKSAFWIYGVTAMVMREPFATVIRHTAAAGLSDWQVRLELIRMALVLMLMARVFLACGLYFDEIYLREDSAARFPRRSYPLDFLAGLMQILIIVGASTVVALHTRSRRGISVFALLTFAFLVFDFVWIGLAMLASLSTAREVARRATFSGAALVAAIWIVALLMGADAVFAEQAAFLGLMALTVVEMARLARQYG